MIPLTPEQYAVKYATRDLPTLQRAAGLAPQQRVAVQAGGNLGVWPKWLGDTFETVYCFEPSPACFQELVRHAAQPNVIKIQAALGDTHGLVAVSDARDDGKPSHPGVTHVSGAGVIPTLRVDDLALEHCDLLSLDLEGYELFALRGAVETVERCRPVMLIEINQHSDRYGVPPDDVRDWLTAQGYQFVARVHSDEIWTPEGQE